MKKGGCDDEKSHPPFFILEIYFYWYIIFCPLLVI